MALNVWTLLGQLGFDTSDFQKGLKDAEKQVKKTAGILESDLTEAAAGASTELDNTAKSAKDVNKALAGDEVKERAKQVKTLAGEHKAGLKPLADVKKGLEEQEKALKEAALAQDRNTQEYRETVRALAEVRRELDSTNKSIEKQAFDFEKLGGQLTKFGGALSLGVTAPLTALAGVGVASAMQLETFAASLEVLIGEAEAANQVFEELYEFSAVVPFDWRSLTEGTRTLAAFGIEADAIVDTLGMLGDVAAGTQSRIQDLAQIYGRVQVTGRAGMEEINRLADRGIPVYTALADMLNVTAGEVRELVSAGMIGFPEIERLFQDLTSAGGQFHGMMEAVGSTTQGRLNTLRDTFEQVTDLIGEALLPTVNRLIGAAQAATDWFINLDEGAQGFAIALGMVLAGTGPLLLALGGIVTAAPKILAFFHALRLALIPLGGPAGLIIGLAVAVGTLAVAFSGPGKDSLTTALDDAAAALAGNDNDSLITALDTVIGKVDGDLRDAFRELRNDLVTTGDLGVQQITRLNNAIANAPEIVKAQGEVARAQMEVASLQAFTRGAADPAIVLERLRDQLARYGRTDLAERATTTSAGVITFAPDDTGSTSLHLRTEQRYFDEINDAISRAIADTAGGAFTESAAAAEELAAAQERLTAATDHLAALMDGLDTPAPTPSPTEAPPPPRPTTTGAGEATAEDEAIGTSRRAEREAERIRRAALEVQESRIRAEEQLEARAIRRAEREHERALRNVEEAALEYQNSRIAAHEAVLAAQESGDQRAAELAATREQRALDRLIAAQVEAQDSRRRSEELIAAREARRQERALQNVVDAQLEAQESRLAGIAQVEAREERRRQAELQAVADAAREYQESRIAGIAQVEAREERRHERELERIREAALEAQEARIRAAETAAETEERIRQRNIRNAQIEAQESRRRAWEEANAVSLVGPGAQPTAVITPDRSQLPAAQLAAILEEEMKARRAMVDELLGFTTEDGPLAALGAGIANLVANSIPLLGTAIEGFVQGGPIGAAVAVFTELLSRTESFSEIMAALDGILNPIVEALDSLLSALMPIITVAINLVQGALQPLVIIIEKVLAPVITFVAGLIAGIYNAVARAINFALGWLGVRLPLIDLETGKNEEAPGQQKGLLEELQAERESLIKQINESTSESEIASLNKRLEEVDAEIARLRALGVDAPTPGQDDPTTAEDREPWVFTGTTQSVQFAVATPLVEAAQEMLLAATTMRDTFAGGDTGSISDFTSALAAATPVLERLSTEGIRVDVGLLGPDAADYTAVGAFR